MPVVSFFSTPWLQKWENCGWLRGVIMQANYRHYSVQALRNFLLHSHRICPLSRPSLLSCCYCRRSKCWGCWRCSGSVMQRKVGLEHCQLLSVIKFGANFYWSSSLELLLVALEIWVSPMVLQAHCWFKRQGNIRVMLVSILISF